MVQTNDELAGRMLLGQGGCNIIVMDCVEMQRIALRSTFRAMFCECQSVNSVRQFLSAASHQLESGSGTGNQGARKES